MIEQHTDMILEFDGIGKRFPGVDALKDVSFGCRKGEVHALVGENGAGKSTLMKCLSGIYEPTAGKIIYKNEPLKVNSLHEAQLKGISIIYQEFSLIEEFTVSENIFLNREFTNRAGFVNQKKAREETRRLLESLGLELDVNKKVNELTVVQQQVVEIVKALSVDADVLIMDEPSATLTDSELRKLFKIICMLREKGVTMIYISHRLEEIFEIADRVTVLKDGQCMGTVNIKDTDREDLIRRMVGRKIEDLYPESKGTAGEMLLEVSGLGLDGKLSDINFDIRAGEILGVAGMVGSGRTQLARCIMGIESRNSGSIRVKKTEQQMNDIREAIASGIGFLPEDRKALGILGHMSVKDNITICDLDSFLWYGLIKTNKEFSEAIRQKDQLQIKVSSIEQAIQDLSGGNQQKALISRWLLKNPCVFILSEPTRGIDVGAKTEIYKLMRNLVEKGKAIVMISSDLPEVIGVSDRIMVMRDGRVEGFINQQEKKASEEEIMSLAVGHNYSLHDSNGKGTTT